MTHTDKAKIINKIGYKNTKHRGIDPGEKVLKHLCLNFQIRVEVDRDGDTYMYKYIKWGCEFGNWNFRTTISAKQSAWEIVEDICNFIDEDVREYNPDLWPNYKLK